jgi:hypothetical protein
LTVPCDFSCQAVYDYLSLNHSGPENAVKVKTLVDTLHLDERRLREWLETQEGYPIATAGIGAWACTRKRDWFPAIRWSVRVFLAWKRRWERQVRMMQLHHPRHGKLFDDDQYRRAA